MYTDFYKLNNMPFQLSPDPSFFYASPGHKRVLSYLQYGVHQGDGFIVVTGDVGTGKTTLIHTLLSQLETEKTIIAAKLVTTHLEPDDLLRMVSIAFELECDGMNKPMLLRNIEKFLREKTKEGKRVLLIVDEAQNLPIKALEELRMLSNYQEGNRALFQSFLIGQEEFRQVLSVDYLEQLRQRVIASYHLGPLDLDDAKFYIEHRLDTAGRDKYPLFTEEAYEKIYDYTEGVPRRINTLCDRTLLVGALGEVNEISGELIDDVIKELKEEIHNEFPDKSVEAPEPSDIRVKRESKESAEAENMTIEQLSRRVAELERIVSRLKSAFDEPKPPRTLRLKRKGQKS